VARQAPRQSAAERAADALADLIAAAEEVEQAAAASLGVNRTDLKIISLLAGWAADLSAGELAQAAGLSPAATSTAISRLVGAGYLTREVDPDDRRRARIGLAAAATERRKRVYGSPEATGRERFSGYTGSQLDLIAGFLRRETLRRLGQAQRIREPSGGPPAK